MLGIRNSITSVVCAAIAVLVATIFFNPQWTATIFRTLASKSLEAVESFEGGSGSGMRPSQVTQIIPDPYRHWQANTTTRIGQIQFTPGESSWSSTTQIVQPGEARTYTIQVQKGHLTVSTNAGGILVKILDSYSNELASETGDDPIRASAEIQHAGQYVVMIGGIENTQKHYQIRVSVN